MYFFIVLSSGVLILVISSSIFDLPNIKILRKTVPRGSFPLESHGNESPGVLHVELIFLKKLDSFNLLTSDFKKLLKKESISILSVYFIISLFIFSDSTFEI